MDGYKTYFHGKKITVMGLGLLGRGVGDIEFLARHGADLLVTDLKTKRELGHSLARLAPYKNIRYALGEHRADDFEDADLIIKAAGVPLDSPFIAAAKAKHIPVEMSTALCVKLLPAGVTVIGITGTRGKSTTTHLLHHILTHAHTSPRRVHLGGNVRGVSTLALLPKIKPGDILLMELDSWQLQGFGENRMSPHIAIFTTFLPDHLNYYRGSMARYWRDKAHIYRHQKRGDSLITGEAVAALIAKKEKAPLCGTHLIPKRSPLLQYLSLPGEHNRANALLAIAAAKVLRIPQQDIGEALKTFRGIPGRLEKIRTYKGITVYNDTTATTPDATIAALKAFPEKKNIILIMGGSDKGLAMGKLLKILPRYCREVILLDGSGTKRIARDITGVPVTECANMKGAVSHASCIARRGDIILLSPAFASFGMFRNEFDRGDQFAAAIATVGK
jgi:UDP-N-acetylmuramoylalanine--D-glutamate ligase